MLSAQPERVELGTRRRGGVRRSGERGVGEPGRPADFLLDVGLRVAHFVGRGDRKDLELEPGNVGLRRSDACLVEPYARVRLGQGARLVERLLSLFQVPVGHRLLAGREKRLGSGVQLRRGGCCARDEVGPGERPPENSNREQQD